jgi:hypothetical protein
LYVTSAPGRPVVAAEVIDQARCDLERSAIGTDLDRPRATRHTGKTAKGWRAAGTVPIGISRLHHYWKDVHGPLIAKVPGVKRYVQNHCIESA